MNINDRIKQLSSPGSDYGMFTYDGNAAAAAAFADIAADPTLTRENILQRTGHTMDILAATHREAWDTEPQIVFCEGITLLCERNGWDTNFTRFDIPSPLREAQLRGQENDKLIHNEAVRILIERHRDEYNTIAASIKDTRH